MLFAVGWLPLVLAVGFGRSARAWTSDDGEALPPGAPAPWPSGDAGSALLLAKRSPSGGQGAASGPGGPGDDATPNASDAQARPRTWPSEVEKLLQSSAVIKGGGRMNWAVCMDKCLAPLEEKVIVEDPELRDWQRVLYWRACSIRVCLSHDMRRARGMSKMARYNWASCMDMCSLATVNQHAPEHISDDPRGTLSACKSRCEKFASGKDLEYKMSGDMKKRIDGGVRSSSGFSTLFSPSPPSTTLSLAEQLLAVMRNPRRLRQSLTFPASASPRGPVSGSFNGFFRGSMRVPGH